VSKNRQKQNQKVVNDCIKDNNLYPSLIKTAVDRNVLWIVKIVKKLVLQL